MLKMANATHAKMQSRQARLTLNMACEMQSIDARIQFGIEVQCN